VTRRAMWSGGLVDIVVVVVVVVVLAVAAW
jgi:hypothetical protein